MLLLSNRTTLILTILLLLYATSRSFAGEQQAAFTRIEGGVTLSTHPSDTPPKNKAEHGAAPRALFEGKYYQVEQAKIGMTVEQGNIVRTPPESKARLIYPNGDQINVGPGTAYRTHWNTRGPEKPHWKLAYGKIRATIAKKGPRSGLRVQTKSAVMGVRGTDFFIAQNGSDATTEVSIIRGQVELTPVVTPSAQDTHSSHASKTKNKNIEKNAQLKPTLVKAGFSAHIGPQEIQKKPSGASPSTPSELARVELRQTTQEELAGIQKSSHVPLTLGNTQLKDQTHAVIRQLEQAASKVTLADIKLHDPKLYASLGDAQALSLDQVNGASLKQLSKTAPKAPKKRKPYSSEIDDLQGSAYDRYFKSF